MIKIVKITHSILPRMVIFSRSIWVLIWIQGFFLDHRPVRRLIHGLSQNKRFLNLFCYTASATIYAIKGGAKSSLSIDMSKTYVDWAKRNFSLNSICSKSNEVIREDCLVWLDKNVKNKDKLRSV